MLEQIPQIKQASFKTIAKEKEFWILVLLGLLYFYRPLFLGETFFFRDLFANSLSVKQLLVTFLEARELPLWNPSLQGGQPYWGYFFPLYPFNLLYLFLPFFRAFNVIIILHFILCSVFVYMFTRIIGFRKGASLVSGIIYGFCGPTLSLGNLLEPLLAIALLPLMLTFWHLVLQERKRKWFLLAVIVGVIQAFAGSPEVNIISHITLLGWTIFYPYPVLFVRRKIGFYIFFEVFVLGISLIQFIPTMEMVLYSSRSPGLDYATFSRWSLHAKRLPEIIFPNFFGYFDLLGDGYWGDHIIGSIPFILSVYLGIVPVFLSCIGGLYKKDPRRILPFRVRSFLFVFLLLSVLLALGRLLPWFPYLFHYVPFFSLFRYPQKFIIAAILPFALLSGYAMEIYSQEEKKDRPKKLLWISWGSGGLLWGFTLIFWLSDGFVTGFEKLWFGAIGEEMMRQGLRYSFTHASLIWLFGVLLWQHQRIKVKRWQQWALICMIAIDLLSAGVRINPSVPEEMLSEHPPVVKLVQERIGDGRLFSLINVDTTSLSLWATSNNIIWFYRWRLETLFEHAGAFYNFPMIFHGGLDGLVSERMLSLGKLIYSLPWSRRLPLLSAGGVTVILSPEKLTSPGIRYITEVPNRSTTPIYLYQNEISAARVEFVTNWNFAATDDEALTFMMTSEFDPRIQVVLQQSETMGLQKNFERKERDIDDKQPDECHRSGRIKKIQSRVHSAKYSVSNSCDGFLVFSEPFYPGWRISVDGTTAPILRANLAFSAIYLSAGEHLIERRYCPNSVLIGSLCSLFFCSLLAIAMYKKLWLS